MLDLTADELDKNVRRNRKYKYLEDLLVNKSEAPSFKFLKDLMIFAAFIGLHYGKKELLDSESKSNGITLKTYSGKGSRDLGQHGLIFLIAMYERKSMDVLRADKVDEAIEIFERYCNGGLSIVGEWLQESNNNPNVLLTKMLQFESSSDKPKVNISGF